MSNYPLGASIDPRAPFNEYDRYINVTISMTISKSVPLRVYNDANLDEFELKRLVENQIQLPTDIDDTWYIDDFTVNRD